LRVLVLLVAVLLGVSCGGKQTGAERAEPITEFGTIIAKEAVEIETVERETRTNTSFHASISSGGGVSIGLGFLLSPFKSSQTVENPIRYQIKLRDGNEVTIYHLSSLFEIGDCVEITAYPDEETDPPEMVRSKQGCDT
jgi:hypothetical protein